MLALGLCGDMKLLSAITAATVKATVVKKPKTFCSRTSAECMIVRKVNLQLQLREFVGAERVSIVTLGGGSGELSVWWS